jgi:flagellar motor switch protein FliN/FliY
MSNGLSQEEINALLQGGMNNEETATSVQSNIEDEEKKQKPKRGRKKAAPKVEADSSTTASLEDKKESIVLTDLEKDIIGEVGNISMGSASTALSDMIGKKVSITTPVTSVTTLKTMRENFEIPNLAVEIKYVVGITGKNIFLMKITDAAIIANLMMGGNGDVYSETLSEIEESAVSEAMNQMIGSSATSMATMFSRKVDISPPKSKLWDATTYNMSDNIEEEEEVIQVAFRLQIENLIDSVIMQVLSVETVKKIVSIMTGTEVKAEAEPVKESNAVPKANDIVIESKQDAVEKMKEQAQVKTEVASVSPFASSTESSNNNMQKVEFKAFDDTAYVSKNTSSLFDVPLNIQVVLGNAQRSIKEIMNFGSGTLLELNQVAGQPVELQINGKVIAYGEVVVVGGNLAINILDVNKNNM